MATQFLKMWWMTYWRLAVISGLRTSLQWILLIVSAIVAVLLVWRARVSLRTFPLVRLARRQTVVIRLANPRLGEQRNAPSSAPRAARIPPRARSASNVPHTNGSRMKASGLGRMTGYEPSRLTHVEGTGRRMHGIPGVGLGNSGFQKDAAEQGQRGEAQLAKAIARYSAGANIAILDTVHSFWSLGMPAPDGQRDRSTGADVDCAFVRADRVLLVDVKRYKGGALAYTSRDDYLYAHDIATGEQIDKSFRLSRNMSFAKERFSAAFPNHIVETRIVIMPTGMGEPVFDKLHWPGGTRVVGVETLLHELETLARLPSAPESEARAAFAIEQLLK